MASLPRADSPDVSLVQGNPDEILQQWHSNSAEWRGPFSVETYIRREKTLLDQDFTRDGGLTAWLLVYQADAQGPRMILCGCETFKKRAFVSRAGLVEEVVCHGVGSVFCPAEHRGKGYAGRMMLDVAERLKTWQQEDKKVLFSILFSDIGKEFYAARGWQVFPSAHISLQPCHNTIAASVKLLQAKDIPSLCSEDEKLLRQRLMNKKTSKTTVAVVPDDKTIAWHHARASFFVKELFGREIVNRGAIAEVSPGGKRVWCYWQHNWSKAEADKDNKLYILHLAIEGEEGEDFTAASEDALQHKDGATARAIASLFAAAQAEAAEWNLSSVDYWNPSSISLAAARLIQAGVEVEHRDSSSITSLLWYGEGPWRDVEWMSNERFAWC